MKSRIRDAGAAVIAVVAWSALGLQYVLSIGTALANGGTWASGAVTYFSFFTILTNTLVAVVLSVPLVAPRSRFGRWLSNPGPRSATATYIAAVGLVYSLALRQIWDPQGAQLVADRLLHDVIPVLYLLFWVFLVEKGRLRWQDAPAWLMYPLAYVVYTLARGAMTNWYPYPFLDVTQLGYLAVFWHVVLLTGGFFANGLLLIGLDRAVARGTLARYQHGAAVPDVATRSPRERRE
jgi:hypothetical protein